MKIKALLFAVAATGLLNLFSVTANGQAPQHKQWDVCFGGSDIEYLYTFIKTADGGFMAGGTTLSDSSGDVSQRNIGYRDFWIVKVDANGNKEWDRRYGGTGGEEFLCMQQTREGGYILAGMTRTGSNGGISGDVTHATLDTGTYGVHGDYWLLKIDASGNKEWDKRYGADLNDWCYSVEQTSDGGYILGGTTRSSATGDISEPKRYDDDYWILKVDSVGNKKWNKRLGGNYAQTYTTTIQCRDGGYLVGGSTHSDSCTDVSQRTRGGEDFWITKLDAGGKKRWDKRYGSNCLDQLSAMKQTDDGGYILAGTSNSVVGWEVSEAPFGMSADYWIVKIDSLGAKQWDKRIGGNHSDGLISMERTSDGGFILSGQSGSPVSGDKTENNLSFWQSWLVKTDAQGNKEWDKTIFTNVMQYAPERNVYTVQTNDGCYVTALCSMADTGGYKTQMSRGGYDFWLIKFCNSSETTGVVVDMNSAGNDLNLFPNPATNNVTISIDESMVGGTVTVSDIMGRKIAAVQLVTRHLSLVTSDFADGVYFVTVTNGKSNETKKLVISK